MSKQVSSNKCAQNTKFPTGGGLVSQDRFKKCLFSSARVQGTQVFSKGYLPPKTFTNDLPTIRLSMRAKDLCLPVKLGSTSSQGQGIQGSSLPRRLFTCAPRPSCSIQSSSGVDSNHRVPRLADKLCQIDFSSSNKITVPRRSMGPSKKFKVPAAAEKRKYSSKTKKVTRKKAGQFKGNSESGRVDQLCKFRSTQGTVEPPITSQSLPVPLTSEPAASVSYPTRRDHRDAMVGCEPYKLFTNTSSSHIELSSDRRVGASLGCQIEQHEPFRPLVTQRNDSPFQPERNVSGVVCIEGLLPIPDRVVSVDTDRQQIGRVVLEERRRDQVETSHEPDLPNYFDSGPIQCPHGDTLHSRPLQQRSGSPVTLVSSAGMASSSQCNTSSICQVGDSPDRPICVSNGACCSEIRDPRCDGSESVPVRCIQPDMELSSSLGVSATLPNASSVATSQLCDRSVPGSSTALGESVLEARPQEPCSRSPIHGQQPEPGHDRQLIRLSTKNDTGHGSRDMEMWGWSESLVGWSLDQKQLLQKSWRDSSLKTYRVAWAKWRSWVSENSVSVSNPTGADLARFLLDLHLKQGLAYNTILVYKSAISTLCNADFGERLSSHILVKQALKSISLKNIKDRKAPIWDTDVLSKWLKDNSVNINSLYECSARAAILLLLCSGRRVHDLTLLSVDKEDCVYTDNSIVLWPKYGSKTDSVSNRQSGWRVYQNTENQTLDPVFWIKNVIKLSEGRRAICRESNLFLTTCGAPKAASRSIIAGWVKKTLHKAGIKASPGSIRPAVASKNWVQNCTLDDILARGNWRSENTFLKFYCREIATAPIQSTCSQSVKDLFAPMPS